MQQWHLLHTKPHKETLVEHQLENRGLETYFPFVQIERGYGRGIRREPFFPHYLFVHVDLRAAEATNLNWLPGVRNIVHFANEPAVVPDSLISELRQRLDRYRKKVLQKREWLFKPGQKVMVTSGPFVGYEAIFRAGRNGHDRVQVLLHVLGTLTPTELNVDQIESITT